MTIRNQELLMQALALSASDRLDIAEQLLQSVVGTDAAARLDESRVREIADECRRRLEKYRRGETDSKSLLDVFPELSADVAT